MLDIEVAADLYRLTCFCQEQHGGQTHGFKILGRQFGFHSASSLYRVGRAQASPWIGGHMECTLGGGAREELGCAP